MGDAGELAVAAVDFVGVVAGDDEEGDAITDLGGPDVLLVEAEVNGRLGRIVPDEAVAAVRDHEGDADVFAADVRVVVPAVDTVIAEIEEALLLLAEAVVVLAFG